MAILIDSGETGSKPLKGTTVDVTLWREFLMSDGGGAWEDSEIVRLTMPTVREVERQIAIARLADYAFVTFSGHGYTQPGRDRFSPAETFVEITSKDSMNVRSLNTGSRRCTVIADSCRHLVLTEAVLNAARGIEKFSRQANTRQLCRQLFDQNLLLAPEGCVYCFGCDIQQGAGEDDESGGYYTSQIIAAGTRWAASTGGSCVYSISDAHDAALVAVQRLQKQQTPVYQGGRRSSHFPFAVRIN